MRTRDRGTGMGAALTISSAGGFELEGRPYRIPDAFPDRVVYSYRRLLEPVPDVPGGATLSREQRLRQRSYLLRRALACVVPGLRTGDLEAVGERQIRALHRWISEHRPQLAGGAPPG